MLLQIWQRKQKNVCLTFLSVIKLRNKTVVLVFLPSFNNKNGCLRQERLFRSRNLAAMVTWRHMSLYRRRGQSYFFLIRHRRKYRHISWADIWSWFLVIPLSQGSQENDWDTFPRIFSRFLWISLKADTFRAPDPFYVLTSPQLLEHKAVFVTQKLELRIAPTTDLEILLGNWEIWGFHDNDSSFPSKITPRKLTSLNLDYLKTIHLYI